MPVIPEETANLVIQVVCLQEFNASPAQPAQLDNRRMKINAKSTEMGGEKAIKNDIFCLPFHDAEYRRPSHSEAPIRLSSSLPTRLRNNLQSIVPIRRGPVF